jgi:hypothetical protein
MLHLGIIIFYQFLRSIVKKNRRNDVMLRESGGDWVERLKPLYSNASTYKGLFFLAATTPP